MANLDFEIMPWEGCPTPFAFAVPGTAAWPTIHRHANTNAIIQNAHNDTDRIIARLDAMESSRKDEKIAEQAAEIQAYKQNAVFGSRIDAATAEILRRSGHDCPSAAYIVQPPTPVNFPANCCGQFNGGWGNGCGNCGNC